MKQLYIIDAANYLFRSYYAIRQMTNSRGESTNALFGFIRSILRLQKDFTPSHLVCVFDGPNNKASRIGIYKEYKGHREGMPEDLFPQLAWAKQFCDAYGIPHIEIDGVEADDTIGSIAKWAETKGSMVYICSSDKDLCQLVNDHIVVLQTYKNNTILDRERVIEKFGVTPEQIIDYLAIVGDTSDNIPGIRGFGAKTAAELLQEFGTLNHLLAHPEKQKSPKRQEKIIAERDKALISQKLATIDIHLSVPNEESVYAIDHTINREALTTLLQTMEFHTLLKELNLDEKIPEKKIKETHKWETLTSEEAIHKFLKTLCDASEIVIDVETSSIDPMQAKLLGVGLSSASHSAAYIPLNGPVSQEICLNALRDFCHSTKARFIGHNIKYDLHVLMRYGFFLLPLSFDTMIASYLLNAGANRHNLDRLVLERFNHQMISYAEVAGGKNNSLENVAIEAVGEYCCEDVDYTMRLKEVFNKELKERGLEKIFHEIEMPLLPFLCKIEHRGIFLDREMLSILSKEFRIKLDKLKAQIIHLADEDFNLNSPKQLSTILFEKLHIRSGGKKTKTGYSTNAEVLESLRKEHPIIELLLEYRSLEKLRSTYVDTLSEQIDPVTGRVHCSFNQSVTATGRLSSNNPNLQNIPIRSENGRRIRQAFRPEKEGWSYLSADYSQIELRILAHLSEDPRLCEAFENDKDVHRTTAAQVFGISEEDVTKEMRSQAKAVNFGLIYGQSAFGLSKELGIPLGEASKFIDAYFAQYPKVQQFLEQCREKGKAEGKAVTMFGRERLLPEINGKNQMLRAQSFRLAVNTPIQGTQADIMKLAMIAIDQALSSSSLQTFCVLQIHDELIFELPDEEIEEWSLQVRKLMETTVSLRVPLKIDISIGKNWGEC